MTKRRSQDVNDGQQADAEMQDASLTVAEQRPERRRRIDSSTSNTANDNYADTAMSVNSAAAPNNPGLDDGLRQLSTLRQRLLTHRAQDGSVTLKLDADEVRQLTSSINVVSNASLLSTVSTEDLLQRMAIIKEVSDYATRHRDLARVTSPAPETLCVKHRTSSSSKSPLRVNERSTFARLPVDVINLILDQLADSYALPSCTSSWNFGSPDTQRKAFWKNLSLLSRTCVKLHEVCGPLYMSELHIQLHRLPKRLEHLRRDSSANLREQLKRLTISMHDFEYSVLRTSDDEGFALPDLLTILPNLTHLSLSTSRTMTPRRRAGTVSDTEAFNQFVGGVNLIDIICQHSKKLQHLNFDPPATVTDVSKLVQQLPELETLALGAHFLSDRIMLPSAVAKLRVFWAPFCILNSQQITAIVTKALRSFAVAVDPEGSVVAGAMSPPFSPSANLNALDKAFQRFGPQLSQLCLAAPHIDDSEFGASLVGQFVTTLALTMMGDPLPPVAGGAGGGRGQGGNEVVNQAGGAAGNQVVLPPAPEQNPAAAPARAGSPHRQGAAPPRGLGGPPLGQPQMFVFPGGIPFAPVRPRNNGNRLPGDRTPAGMGPAGGAPGDAEVEPPLPLFFDKLLRSCPNVWHLGLLGPQYTHELLFDLPSNVEHLRLSKPGQRPPPAPEGSNLGAASPLANQETAAVVEHLCTMLSHSERTKGKPGLKRLELSGKAGEWKAADRKTVKDACDKAHVGYASVDML
ncbi:hypothetical protein ACM66B_001874 [Microbotryomycetes sp. NB124-2]